MVPSTLTSPVQGCKTSRLLDRVGCGVTEHTQRKTPLRHAEEQNGPKEDDGKRCPVRRLQRISRQGIYELLISEQVISQKSNFLLC